MANMPQYDSLTRYINRRTLFIKDIDPSVSKEQIKTELLAVCPRNVGKICVPVDYQTAASLQCAYCNFNSEEAAVEAYRRHRFRLKLKGKPVKLIFAVDSKESRDKVFGQWGLKFVVYIKNLSSEVDAETLCDKFEAYGEVFQCQVGIDHFNQCYGKIQYVNEQSVKLAVDRANKTKFHNTVILVEPHRLPGGAQPAAPGNPPALRNAAEFPALSGTGSTGQPPSTPQSLDDYGSQVFYDEEYQVPVPVVVPVESRAQSGSMNGVELMLPVEGTGFGNGGGGVREFIPPQLNNGPLSSVQPPSFFVQGSVAPPAALPVTQQLFNPPAVQNGVAHAMQNGPMQNMPYRPVLPIFQLANRPPLQNPPGPPMNNTGQQVPAKPPAAVSHQPTRKGMTTTLNGNKSAGKELLSAKNPKDHVLHVVSQLNHVVAQLDRLGEMLCCPITQEVLQDPVVAADGHTYERAEIEKWFTSHDTSPMTNQKLCHKNLLPNNLIKTIIHDFL